MLLYLGPERGQPAPRRRGLERFFVRLRQPKLLPLRCVGLVLLPHVRHFPRALWVGCGGWFDGSYSGVREYFF